MMQIFLILSICAAVLFLMLFVHARQQANAIKIISQQQRGTADIQMADLKKERDQYLMEKISFTKELTVQTTRNENLVQLLQTRSAELGELQERFKKEFENLANKLLDEKSEKFTKQNQTNIEGLLKPLREKIKEFEQKVEDTYNRESRERFNLQKELQRMFELNQTLSDQANNLTNALRADTKKQGNWGEYLLERILETAGLKQDIHYLKQASVNDANEDMRRPDIVILLPEQRHVIVDAKVSLTAYERYFNAANEEEQQRAIRDHVRSVKKHIEELYTKGYDKLFDASPDFVLMFIPVEPAYSLALMQDNHLFEEAFRKRVILVSISSLLATLRIIDSVWRLEKQNRNAAEIVRQGTQMYDKIAGFVEDMQELGIKLRNAEKTYTQAMNKLSDGRGSLISRAEAMKELGLDPKKQLPKNLISLPDKNEI